jgi:hypothetical protein
MGKEEDHRTELLQFLPLNGEMDDWVAVVIDRRET